MEILNRTVQCECEFELNRVLNEIKEGLNKDDRTKINSVFTHLLVKHGLNHAFRTLNHMRVRDILELEVSSSEPILEGNKDGMHFRLLQPPDAQ